MCYGSRPSFESPTFVAWAPENYFFVATELVCSLQDVKPDYNPTEVNIIRSKALSFGGSGTDIVFRK